MKFLTDNILLIGLALGSAFMLLLPMIKKTSGGAANVSPNDAVLLINRSNAVVVDVRNDAEFASGHITDAKHIPVEQLEDRLAELRKFKDKPLLVYCQSGIRSAKASSILLKSEFTQVHNLEGGINAWVQAKLPVVKSA